MTTTAEELLRRIAGCAYPVSTEIKPKGYSWSEVYLDQVKPDLDAYLSRPSPAPDLVEAATKAIEKIMNSDAGFDAGDLAIAALAVRPSDDAGDAEAVERGCRAACAADGRDWDEVCAYEADPDAESCDSGTCVAAYWEDHLPDEAREQVRKMVIAAQGALRQPKAEALPSSVLIEAIEQAAQWFDEYADHHSKLAEAAGFHVGKERNAKAERNAERAAWLRSRLDLPAGEG